VVSELLAEVREKNLMEDVSYALFLTAAKYYFGDLNYHKFSHALMVVSNVLMIYADLGLPPDHDVLIAAMWHDAIYIPGSAFSEALSADALLHEAGALMKQVKGLSENNEGWIASIVTKMYIKYTRVQYHLAEEIRYVNDGTLILLDADIASLGTPSYSEFENNQYAIISEQLGHLDVTEEHLRKSAAFLKQFLDKKSIYRSYPAKGRWEERARANISQFIAEHAA
jgi:predicted metal-dependent HD superfamily phosphohydrolase